MELEKYKSIINQLKSVQLDLNDYGHSFEYKKNLFFFNILNSFTEKNLKYSTSFIRKINEKFPQVDFLEDAEDLTSPILKEALSETIELQGELLQLIQKSKNISESLDLDFKPSEKLDIKKMQSTVADLQELEIMLQELDQNQAQKRAISFFLSKGESSEKVISKLKDYATTELRIKLAEFI